MEVVLVALIGGPLMWLLHRLDKRNSAQHADGQANADRRHAETLDAIDRVDRRLDDHITWHLGARGDKEVA